MNAADPAVRDVLPDFKGLPVESALAALHGWKQPGRYFEITCHESRTLQHAACPTVVLNTGARGIGQQSPETLGRLGFVAKCDSKVFFRDFPLKLIFPEPIDLAFISSGYRSDVLLHEFTHLERLMSPDAVVALHNCLPLEPAIAERRPNPGAVRAPHRHNWWAGDLWRAALYLKRHRPDLVIRAFDARPTGLVCITRLDPRRQLDDDERPSAIATMMNYDLEKIGVSAFLEEMEVQSTTVLAEQGGLGRIFPARRAPVATDTVALVEALRTAPRHSLATATLENVVLQAMRGHPISFQGGPVLDGAHDPLRHQRGWKPKDSFEPGLDPQKRLEGSYIYAGYAYGHFGHFMAEMVHRIVPSLQTFGAGTFLLVNAQGASTRFEDLPAWMRGILRYVGIGAHNLRVISDDCRVERLQICQQGSCLDARSDRSYLELLKQLTAVRRPALTRDRTPSRIYVSRSRVAHGGNFLGERYIEQLLNAQGYHVMHPEELEFEQQLALYLGAQDIIFCEGSACHGTELFGAGDLNRVLLIVKREPHTYSRVLEPRSRQFHMQSGHRIVGSLMHGQGGVPQLHVGVHLLDIRHFVDDLHDKGFCDIRPLFDADAYWQAARADLYDYVTFHLRQRREGLAKPHALEGFLSEFNRLEALGQGLGHS